MMTRKEVIEEIELITKKEFYHVAGYNGTKKMPKKVKKYWTGYRNALKNVLHTTEPYYLPWGE